MARIIIDKYLSLGASTPLVATSYQVALDANFTQIVDEIHQSIEHKLEWETNLPKIGSSGFYSDRTLLYSRVKLFLRDDTGALYAPDDWYVLPSISQVEYNKEHETITGEVQ